MVSSNKICTTSSVFTFQSMKMYNFVPGYRGESWRSWRRRQSPEGRPRRWLPCSSTKGSSSKPPLLCEHTLKKVIIKETFRSVNCRWQKHQQLQQQKACAINGATTQNNDIQRDDTQHNDIQHNDTRHNSDIIKRVSWFKSSLLLRIQSDSITNINS